MLVACSTPGFLRPFSPCLRPPGGLASLTAQHMAQAWNPVPSVFVSPFRTAFSLAHCLSGMWTVHFGRGYLDIWMLSNGYCWTLLDIGSSCETNIVSSATAHNTTESEAVRMLCSRSGLRCTPYTTDGKCAHTGLANSRRRRRRVEEEGRRSTRRSPADVSDMSIGASDISVLAQTFCCP